MNPRPATDSQDKPTNNKLPLTKLNNLMNSKIMLLILLLFCGTMVWRYCYKNLYQGYLFDRFPQRISVFSWLLFDLLLFNEQNEMRERDEDDDDGVENDLFAP